MRKTIITTAVTRKKPNRKQAFEEVNHLIAKMGDDQRCNDALATLYSYFLPNAPKQAKTDLEWISKAVGKMDVRNYLNYLYCDGNKLVATDGHRLHWMESVPYHEGFYVPVTGEAIEDQGTYPNVERVIPTRQANTLIKISELIVDSSEIANGRPFAVYQFPNGSWFQAQFIDEAFNGEDEMLWNPETEENQSIHLQTKDGKRNAVVMPMRR